MKFKETLLYKIITHPIEAWKNTNPYSFVLASPFLALHFVLGVFLALIFDGWVAMKEAGAE